MNQSFPQLYMHSGGNVNVNWINYATKTNLKEAVGIDTFMLA